MNLHLFQEVFDFLASIPKGDSSKIYKDLGLLEAGQSEKVYVKRLRGKVKELIVKQYRLVFFYSGQTIYVLYAFKKQSQKTPERVIKKAQKIYQKIPKQP